MGGRQGQNITYDRLSMYSTQVQYTSWQPDSWNKGWQPISFKVCQYYPFAVTKNLLHSACLWLFWTSFTLKLFRWLEPVSRLPVRCCPTALRGQWPSPGTARQSYSASTISASLCQRYTLSFNIQKKTLRALRFAFVWSSALISGLSQFQCWMSINISHSGQNLFEQSLSNIWTLLSIFCLIQFPSLERVHYCEMKSINPQSLISQQSTLWEVLADTLYTTKIIQNIKLSIAVHYLIDF